MDPLSFDTSENVTKECVHGANHQKWETNQIGPPLQTHICREMASPKSLKIHSTIPSESGARCALPTVVAVDFCNGFFRRQIVARIGIKVRKRAQGFVCSFFSGTLHPQGDRKGVGRQICRSASRMNQTGGNVKSRKILTCMTAMTLFVALAVPIRLAAQTNYSVVELAGLGGTSGGANGINDRGWITGANNLPGDLTSMATLWVNGSAIPLGTLSGGPNSAVAWPVKSNNGVIVGISELPDADPTREFFSCWPFFAAATPSGLKCKGFRWQNGQMTALEPFPGGFSSYATGVNNQGQVVGWAENGVHDPTCNTSFQILQFRAVIWQPNGTMQELPPLPGDSTSAATAINDLGQVVGISGDCGVAVGSVSARHASTNPIVSTYF